MLTLLKIKTMTLKTCSLFHRIWSNLYSAQSEMERKVKSLLIKNESANAHVTLNLFFQLRCCVLATLQIKSNQVEYHVASLQRQRSQVRTGRKIQRQATETGSPIETSAVDWRQVHKGHWLARYRGGQPCQVPTREKRMPSKNAKGQRTRIAWWGT